VIGARADTPLECVWAGGAVVVPESSANLPAICSSVEAIGESGDNFVLISYDTLVRIEEVKGDKIQLNARIEIGDVFGGGAYPRVLTEA
jgi:hypothetical protein